jgi:hypothetical protein
MAILTEVFCNFSQSMQSNAGVVPQVNQKFFLPNPFQIISQPIIQHYIVLMQNAIKYLMKNKRLSSNKVYS